MERLPRGQTAILSLDFGSEDFTRSVNDRLERSDKGEPLIRHPPIEKSGGHLDV
jgi:hypothetical protein